MHRTHVRWSKKKELRYCRTKSWRRIRRSLGQRCLIPTQLLGWRSGRMFGGRHILLNTKYYVSLLVCN